MASCTSYGALSSTFDLQASVGKNLGGSCTVSICVPSSRTGIIGSRARIRGFEVANRQARCSPSIGKRLPHGQRHSSHVTSIAISKDIALEEEDPVSREELSSSAPSTFEVHQLLMELCDETSIAELQLKVGSFRLNVKRDVGKFKITNAAPPVAPPPVPSKPMVDLLPSPSVSSKPMPQTSAASGLVSSLSKPLSSTWALLESAADEGLQFVKSPKCDCHFFNVGPPLLDANLQLAIGGPLLQVGYFRKGRVAKGKKGPPLLDEGQVIKEGHVVCYLEQLGTQQPVESQISGEVVKVLWDDGEPVGYGDPLIAIRPSFPGIKKLT